ncbi:MAG: hypothetical protein HQK51_17920 [Oligoflexia bacterium]|nr:hypothetical protein [Oligoflexia bacterium]
MSSFLEPRIKTYYAQDDLFDKQYHFVTFGDADEKIVLANSKNGILGVLMNRPKKGDAAEIALPGGGAELKMSATITRGDNISVTEVGQGKKSSVNGEFVGAVAMENGVPGKIISVDLVRCQQVGGNN